MEDRNTYAALAGLSDDLSRLATAVAPRLVSIEAGRRRSATGTVWRDGVVVTTAHAIRDTEHMRAIGPGAQPLAATLAGWDLASDLAVLKVEQLTGPDLSMQGDLRAMQVGELVVALAGSSKAPTARLTMVSGVGRLEPLRRGGRRGDVIELDIEPFSGFSGGPLVDSRGASSRSTRRALYAVWHSRCRSTSFRRLSTSYSRADGSHAAISASACIRSAYRVRIGIAASQAAGCWSIVWTAVDRRNGPA